MLCLLESGSKGARAFKDLQLELDLLKSLPVLLNITVRRCLAVDREGEHVHGGVRGDDLMHEDG